jgi:acetyl-CoA C-acetyltransferase
MQKRVEIFLGTAAFYEKEAKGVDFPFPKIFAKLADEIIDKYNFDEARFMDSLAKIATINYANAKKNGKAQTRNWFMDENQTSQRGSDTNNIVSGRLAITDCSQVTDGAAVVILASEEYMNKYCETNDCLLANFPYIKGWGFRVAPMRFDVKIKESESSPYILKWTRQAVLDAYERADLTVDDIDVFETHDCFTSSEFAAISAFGIAEPGKEIEAIENGVISFDGEKPINPSGGLIGGGHPVGATGARMLLDLYKQLAGKAGNIQLPNVKNGCMLNIGGSATTNYVCIIGK